MTNEITKAASTDLIQFDDDKVALIKRTIAPTATDDELEMFLHQCRRTGLDPLAKQIYFQKYNTKTGPKVSIITGIDGYRLVADRTGLYAGSDDAVFEGRIKHTRYNEAKDVPVKARVTVYKIVAGKRVPFTSSAYWDEYYPGDKMGHMWFKMPHVMLAKAAEAQALRKAFPADLSGVYTREEMDQATAEWEDLPATDTGSNGEPDTIEFGDLRSATEEDAPDEPADARGATSPQKQAERKRPAAPKTNGDGASWKEKALKAKSLPEFASAAAFGLDGYKNDHHVTSALEGVEDFEYNAAKNEVYWDWLAERKTEEA